ncbi:MAG: FadR/GntR family transcriptional regulator [Paludibacter sp.]|nr:FadR/GntR family transcriptional regulator [Paludibacter sp.]MDD4198729.1 FadR/GntR family transcriptional regulator [Paludibacter sp.]MDD4428424.1 FadR/GntR family transcriptional regulator [Paludibacter sp.]
MFKVTSLNNKEKQSDQVNAPDKVIAKIKDLISSGVLKPGDRLPAERKMAAEFGFGRAQVREALHKLEFYGIIKTLPQSGSIINRLDITALDGLIMDVINLQDYDFFSLVETRILLEENAISMCAKRRTEEDLIMIEKAHNNFVKYWDSEERMIYDFAFHRAIAEASHNPVVKAMILIITPDILHVYNKERFCAPSRIVVEEHVAMLEAIREQNPGKAAALMKQHMQGVLEFAKSKVTNKYS